VLVFRSAERGLPRSTAYKHGRDIVEVILKAREHGPQIDDPNAIRDYFGRLFSGRNLDACQIRSKREKFQFATIAQGEKDQDGRRAGRNAYRLIDDPGEPVVVERWTARAAEIASLLDNLDELKASRAAFRALAPFQVNLLPSQVVKAHHHLRDGPAGLKVWSSGYDDDLGIIEELPDSFIV
jgi:hypothetical protein